MSPIEKFNAEKKILIKKLENPSLQELSQRWLEQSFSLQYQYNFTWCGIPVIQYPQDLVAMQEIIWEVKPDLIIEAGVAHGGSVIFYSSMLELLGNGGKVVGIDIDIRKHNRERLEAHPLFKNILLIEGSSTEASVVEQVQQLVKPEYTVLVALDSYHTHAHVLKELEIYSPLVTKESYVVVFDTIVEQLSDENFPHRPWKKGNNPHSAVQEFLTKNSRFKIDEEIHTKLLITSNFNGYLKAIE